VELPLILRILFIGTCWPEVGESILTPIELADGGVDGGVDGADDKEDICAEAVGSVMENNEVKLKVFHTRAMIKIANIKLNLDNILV
jgi:hypothetical protein